MILGTKAYEPLVESYRMPCAVAGFEPVDILQAVLCLVEQMEGGVRTVRELLPQGRDPGGEPQGPGGAWTGSLKGWTRAGEAWG